MEDGMTDSHSDHESDHRDESDVILHISPTARTPTAVMMRCCMQLLNSKLHLLSAAATCTLHV